MGFNILDKAKEVIEIPARNFRQGAVDQVSDTGEDGVNLRNPGVLSAREFFSNVREFVAPTRREIVEDIEEERQQTLIPGVAKEMARKRELQSGIVRMERYGDMYGEGPIIDPFITGGIKRVGGKAIAKTPVFKGFQDMTTHTLEFLKGKSVVSRQFIEDITKQSQIRQAEKDIVTDVLKEFKDKKVPVQEFAEKVKVELLPLKRQNVTFQGRMTPRYEGVTLPDEARGPVGKYEEHIYESPIKTTAGNAHFSHAESKNYFAHTRAEDLLDDEMLKWQDFQELSGGELVEKYGTTNFDEVSGGPSTTRRILEVQSDLFQRGRLAEENNVPFSHADVKKELEDLRRLSKEQGTNLSEASLLEEAKRNVKEYGKPYAKRQTELAKLEPYRNKFHEPVIRQEVKQAAIDGKTKLQFPTGETAMKIEGLDRAGVETTGEIGEIFDFQGGSWVIVDNVGGMEGDVLAAEVQNTFHWADAVDDIALQLADNPEGLLDELNNSRIYSEIKDRKLLREVYDTIFSKESRDKTDGELLDLLEEKFDLDEVAQELAATRYRSRDDILEYFDDFWGETQYLPEPNNDFGIVRYDPQRMEAVPVGTEGINKNNPIYKFYEDDIGKFLKNKFGAKRITDPQGVDWWELDVPKTAADEPTLAFGGAPIGAIIGGGAAVAGAAGLGAMLGQKNEFEIQKAAQANPFVQQEVFMSYGVPEEQYQPAQEASKASGIPVLQLVAQFSAENGGTWNPATTSPTGAKGITQLTTVAIEEITKPRDFLDGKSYWTYWHPEEGEFDINNVTHQWLGAGRYLSWVKNEALPELGIEDPTFLDIAMSYGDLGPSGYVKVIEGDGTERQQQLYNTYRDRLRTHGYPGL